MSEEVKICATCGEEKPVGAYTARTVASGKKSWRAHCKICVQTARAAREAIQVGVVNAPHKFYVYEHWRPDIGACFYVGKGFGRRANDMRNGRNRWHKFIQAKLASLGTAVEVKIISEGLSEREAFEIEMQRIAFWKSDGADLCNLTPGGDGPSGQKHTEEWKRANSERMKGRVTSEETRAKQSAAAMGNKRSLGKKKPQHVIDAMIARFTGVPKSDETRRKISESKKGQVRAHTPEEDARASARQKGIPKPESVKANMRGVPKSEAHKQKLREFNLGKTHSEETRAKLAEISRRMWAKRKSEKQAQLDSMNLTLKLEEK